MCCYFRIYLLCLCSFLYFNECLFCVVWSFSLFIIVWSYLQKVHFLMKVCYIYVVRSHVLVNISHCDQQPTTYHVKRLSKTLLTSMCHTLYLSFHIHIYTTQHNNAWTSLLRHTMWRHKCLVITWLLFTTVINVVVTC